MFDLKSPYVEQDVQDLLTQWRHQFTKYRNDLDKIINDINKKAAEDEDSSRTKKYEYMLKDTIHTCSTSTRHITPSTYYGA